MSEPAKTYEKNDDAALPAFMDLLRNQRRGELLTGVIDWSWWWVTAPLWAPLVVAVAVIVPIALVVEAWGRR